MTSLINALNSGKTSLLTNQKAMEIVGNNIANVNTEGYSRQRAEFEQIPAVNFNDFFIGQGVTVSDVQRDYSVFINRQLQDKSIEYGEETGKSNSLSELQRIFSVSNDNLAAKINDFFDAWQQLSANPSGQVERDVVLQRGKLLGDAFNGMADDLDTVQQNMNTEITADVDTINQQLDEIAKANDRIHQVEISGQTANATRDQRDLLVKKLSETIGIKTYTDNTGQLNVILPTGMPLVQGNVASTIQAVTSGSDLTLKLKVAGNTLNIPLESLGGKFRGMFETRDVFMKDLRTQLDTLAKDLTKAVNDQHKLGYGSDGVNNRNFFNDLTDIVAYPPASTVYAKNVAVALTNTSQVAAAVNATAAPGDNANSLKIAQLEVTHKVSGTNDTFDSYFSQIVSTVGIEGSRHTLALKGTKDATDQLQNLRDSYSGVSLEEEMINLMQFQRGFQSSAKFLSTVDEMMNSLIQLKT